MSTGPFKDLDEFKKWFKEECLNDPEHMKKVLNELRGEPIKDVEELLPCPFCGGKALRGCSPDSWGKQDMISCEDCHASVQDQYMKKSCTKIWQNRVD